MARLINTMLIAVLLMVNTVGALAQHTGYKKTYTPTSPLVYEDAWDLWPYVFLNEKGEPDGYNVELLRLIFSELDIPFVIKLKPTKEALNDLKEGKSDLMLGMDADFHNDYGSYGQAVLHLFTHSVAFPKGKPHAKNFDDLHHERVMVHGGSFSHHYMENHGLGSQAVPFDDMKEVMQKLNGDGRGQVLWNTMSLKWLINYHQLDNLDLAPIDVPPGEYKFMATDPYLLARLDSVYGELYARELLQPLQVKWFYPEQHETGIPMWVWNIAVLMAIIALGFVGSYMVYKYRERKVNGLIQKNNTRLGLILQTSEVEMWSYDIAARRFTWYDDAGKPAAVNSYTEFMDSLQLDNNNQLYDALMLIAEQRQTQAALEMTTKADEHGERRDFVLTLSVLRTDRSGKPLVILGIRSDVTEERHKQQAAKNTMLRYQSVFNTAMVDMVYFDAEGIVTEINQKACRTFNLTDEDLQQKPIAITDIINLEDINMEEGRIFYTTVIQDRPKAVGAGEVAEKMYYELQLVPVYDSGHTLLGVYGTGRDVTEIIRSYRRVADNMKLLQKANKEVTDYVQNINYALKVGGVRVAIYSPATHILTIYSQMDVVQHRLTQTRCLSLIADSQKPAAMKLFISMDNETTKTVDATLETVIRRGGRRLQLQLHFIPVFDEQGKVSQYFGMCRDVTDIQETEKQLAVEVLRAQETETVKNAFMQNMSYEIRTPLNSVVGFAELFQQEHAVEDEPVFIREIKENSGRLLKLINSILFLSRLDAHMIEYNVQPVDFAKVFEGLCQMGWNEYRRDGVDYVVENAYNRLVLNLDDQNLGHAIAQVAANAAQNTSSGMVRAYYEYMNDVLAIAITDTGCGIAESKLSQIFERFSHSGTGNSGLGLSICKELITQMGGSIKIKSKVGQGTTVWLSLPCQALEIDRK